MRKLKKIFNLMFSRLFLVVFMLLFQIALLAAIVIYSAQLFLQLYPVFVIISLLVVLGIISTNENTDYKLTWIIAILLFPVVGGIFYLIFANRRLSPKLKSRVHNTLHNMHGYLPEEHPVPESPDNLWLSKYTYNLSGYPVCDQTSVKYFSVGEEMFSSMLEELSHARRYIMLEYFIVKPGVMFDSVFMLLSEKVKEGVSVYFMYDDLGSIGTMPKKCDQALRDAGIHVCNFNPFRPRLNVMLNHRDHRKIMIIDGETVFCGGINISDEYINKKDRFGHWKDTGVRLQGKSAWPATLMYLQHWHFATGEELNPEDFTPQLSTADLNDGMVQMFGDSPLDKINLSETVYSTAIMRANRYIYITTPYLVIDFGMEQALCAAAASGVDVRIITPHRYDKWYVHMLTRSHYAKLIQAGVKIYEYTPGFMHGKMFVSDDEVCMVGTCNMDFRSFYLHFECSVLFYASSIIQDVKRDMLQCQEISQRITRKDAESVPLHLRLLRTLLKIFAPLM